MSPPSSVPGLVVLGAPKAGTTTLAAWWDAHPHGFTAPGKEVQYFNRRHELGSAWYAEQFRGAAPGQVACDATPAYLYDRTALERLASELPDSRVVALLREPVSRAWSSWCMFAAFGVERRSFAQVVEAAEQGRLAEGIDHVGLSRYLPHLQRVAALLGRERLLVLLTDDLRTDPQGVLDALSDHAGVPRAPYTPTGDRNAALFPRFPGAQKRLRSLPDGALRERLLRANAGAGALPGLDPALGERLRTLLAPQVAELEQWLERPLPGSWRSAA